MRILYFSDLHLDARCCGQSRFQELQGVLREIVDVFRTKQCDTLVFGGDASDPDSPMLLRVITELIHFSNELRDSTGRGYSTNQYWINGNHDVLEDGHGTSTLSPLAELDSTYVIDNAQQIDNIGFLPFPSASNVDEPARVAASWKKYGVGYVFGHLDIPGLHGASESDEMARGRKVYWPSGCWEEDRPRLFGGHYHIGGDYELPCGRKVWVVGAPAPFSFGAEEKAIPRVLVIDTMTGQVESVLLAEHVRLHTVQATWPSFATGTTSYVRVMSDQALSADERYQIERKLGAEPRIKGWKFVHGKAEVAPGEPELVDDTRELTADDGIEIAKQLAQDIQVGEAKLKEEIQLLVDELADGAT